MRVKYAVKYIIISTEYAIGCIISNQFVATVLPVTFKNNKTMHQ